MKASSALRRAFSPEALRIAQRRPEEVDSLLGIGGQCQIWLTATLDDLEQHGFLASRAPTCAAAEGRLGEMTERFGDRLLDVLQGKQPALALLGAEPNQVATLLANTLIVPPPLRQMLCEVVRRLFREFGPRCRVLDALGAFEGSFMAHALRPGAEGSPVTAFWTSPRRTPEPEYSEALFQEVGEDWTALASVSEPYGLLALAGSLNADRDLARLRALWARARFDATWLVVAPGNGHPVARYLLGLLEPPVIMKTSDWQDGLADLGVRDFHLLHEAPDGAWIAWVAGGDPAARQTELSIEVSTVGTTLPNPSEPEWSQDIEVHAAVRADVAAAIEYVLHHPAAELDWDQDLTDLGMDSILAKEVATRLSQTLGLSIPPTIFFSSNTAEKLVEAILTDHRPLGRKGHDQESSKTDVSIRDGSIPNVKAAQEDSGSEPPPPVLAGPPSESFALHGANVSSMNKPVLTDLMRLIEEVLQMPPEELDPDADLTELGLDSILAGELATKLSHALKIKVAPTIFFTSHTPSQLAQTLVRDFPESVAARYPQRARSDVQAANTSVVETPSRVSESGVSESASIRGGNEKVNPVPKTAVPESYSWVSGAAVVRRQDKEKVAPEAVAVIGLAGTFSGAKTVDELFGNLAAGRESLSELPVRRWQHLGWDLSMPEGAQVRVGLLPDAETFDALHFRIPPREAETMDPRQRYMLQWAWQAIESAGYRPSSLAGSNTAVFVGVENNEYAEYVDRADPFFATSTGMTMVANRVSYVFDLRGTSQVVDASCSSSLLAIYQAVCALQHGEADLALAGGVSLLLSPQNPVEGIAAGLLSPRGSTRSFDREANGWVMGEGGGLVLLKPLSEALRVNDLVLGVIRGAAANHGGRVSSVTAPSPERMGEVAALALAQGGVEPQTVTYVEAHGVGGQLADAAEFHGLSRAYHVPSRSGHCALGSLTPNIGNLDPASGVAGLIKVILSLEAKQLPPQIRFSEPNSHVDLSGSPFRIHRERVSWQPSTDDGQVLPLRAGLHSYASGGTNVHLVLEQSPQSDTEVVETGPQLALLSARTEDLLRDQARALSAYLENNPQRDLRRLCATLQLGREPMPARLAVQVSSTTDLRSKLEAWLSGSARVPKCWSGVVEQNRPKAAMIGDTPACLSYIRDLFRRGLLEKVAALWVDGSRIPWEAIYEKGRPRPLRIPSYIFKKEPCFFLPRSSGRPPQGRLPRGELESALNSVAVGELDPRQLLDRLAPAVSNTKDFDPAQGQVEVSQSDHPGRLAELLREMIKSSLRLPSGQVDLDTPLTDLGVDSLTGMAFMKDLQARFGTQIPMTLLLEHGTLGEISRALWSDFREVVAPTLHGASRSHEAWSPLVTIQRGRDRAPSFWVHGAIGDVSWLIEIAHQLGHTYPIYGLEPKGLYGETPHRTVSEMASSYLQSIRDVQPEGPYQIGGYSGGGIIAFEMVHQLQAQGERVARMLIGDTFMRGSTYFDNATRRLRDELDLQAVQLTALANIFAGITGSTEVVSYPQLEALSEEERIATVARHLVDNTNAPRDFSECREWVQNNLTVSLAMVDALTSYDPQALKQESATSFFSCIHGYISPDSKSAIPMRTPRMDHVEHWQRMAPGPFDLVEVQCDHLELMHQPHVTQVVQHLREVLI